MIPILLTDTVTPDPERALYYTMLWGLEGVMLRTVEKGRVPHLNLPRLRHHLEEAEMPVMAVSPGLFESSVFHTQQWMNDLFLLDEVLTFTQKMNCPLIEVSAFTAPETPQERLSAIEKAVQVLQKAGDRAAKANTTLAVLNEQGGIAGTSAELAELLSRVNHPHVRGAWNPYTAIRLGEDIKTATQNLAGRTELVRLRDGIGQSSGWKEKVLGTGDLNLSEMLDILYKAGFRGLLVQEVFTEPKGPTGLHSATALIHMIRAITQKKAL
ncbi:MAG: sugar phosphate isomerase/epimerase [Bacteroidetes Order II. Incertae sedis bacterium]|nr:sugar phosphate isomerase/epimerase [Bacteroidetes Order II. bacterium]